MVEQGLRSSIHIGKMLGKCLEVVKHAWKCIRVPLFDLHFPKVSIHFDSASAQKLPPKPVPTAEGPRIAVIIFEIFGHTWERHKDGEPPWYDVTGGHFNPRKTTTWIESQTLVDHTKFTVHLSNSTNHFLKFHGTETSWATRPFHSAAILYPWLKSPHHTWETKNASLWQDHNCIPEGFSKLIFL